MQPNEYWKPFKAENLLINLSLKNLIRLSLPLLERKINENYILSRTMKVNFRVTLLCFRSDWKRFHTLRKLSYCEDIYIQLKEKAELTKILTTSGVHCSLRMQEWRNESDNDAD